ncbi:MAG: linear amide C-N hydrolase [Bacteriovorax sp.]|nr:linear amide C-N hydrolase [Bacteriovorax sp.]
MKNQKLKKTIASALFLFAFIVQPASTCTIFSLYPNNQHWVGRTFDWAYGHGLVFTNKRNVTKNGLKLVSTDISGNWTSKYGSVTFNQFGREFPTGGMNEAGLVVDALELKTSVFPGVDARASLNELQFIQYLLDNFSTVESITLGLQDVRLSPVGSKLHYFACDIKKCMTIEFVNGQLVTHQSGDLPISSFANNTYEEHLAYAKDFITFGGDKPIVIDSKDSLDRFVRASYNAKFINKFDDPTQAIFAFLSDVGSKNNRWQLIYNQDEKTITFRTTAKLTLQRKVDLAQFDFSCKQSSQYFDLDSDSEGQVNTEFKTFDSAINYSIIKKSVDLQGLPPLLAGRLAIYPNETLCN